VSDTRDAEQWTNVTGIAHKRPSIGQASLPGSFNDDVSKRAQLHRRGQFNPHSTQDLCSLKRRCDPSPSYPAIAAFEVLQTGSVGVTGKTAAVLHRSLVSMRALTDPQRAENG
jgi:hypothetical protein